ncbi:hypothetical protein PQR39_42110 [Paraburkholderia sediminicola]|uniref:hypothetical protein n=1 Tax=Paraburkholderia sediminicola TaxID=458836 RepID=UPI0038B6B762
MEVSTMEMPKPLAVHRVDPLIVEAWVTGWALSRRTPAPTVLPIGFRVDVGLPQQNARYVLPEFRPEVVTDLASRIHTPWTFIKVCAEPRTVAEVLPPTWTVQAPVFMMTAALADNEGSRGEQVLPNWLRRGPLPEGQKLARGYTGYVGGRGRPFFGGLPRFQTWPRD